YLGDTAMVVEQEQAPRAMVCAGLVRDRDLHPVLELFCLRGVAEREIGVTDCPEGGRVKGRCRDRAIAVVDRRVPLMQRGVEARLGGEDAIVARVQLEPR